MTKILKDILKKNWVYYVSRKFNWFVQYTQIQSNSKKVQSDLFGFSINSPNYLILNGDEYYLESDAGYYYQIWDSQFKKDNSFFENFAHKITKIVEETENYTNILQHKDFSILSNTDLIDEVSTFTNNFIKSFTPAWMRPDDYLEEKLKSALQQELKVKIDELEQIFTTITESAQVSKLYYIKEPLELLKIAQKVKATGISLNEITPEIESLLDKHAKSYSWLKGPVYCADLHFTKEEYITRLKEMLAKDIGLELEKRKKTRLEYQSRYGELLSTYDFTPELLNLTEATRNFIFLRTFVVESSDYLFWVFRHTLCQEIVQRTNIHTQDLIMLNPEEIKTLLEQGKSLKQVIEDRKKGYAIIWTNGKLNQLFGKTAQSMQKDIANYFNKQVSRKTLNVIKGRGASLGKVTGIAKVLKSHTEVDKVDKGNILVTKMTTPDYIIAMEKAAAFVTDEGGITCHAAIISRELGVPCIVGTKNATSIIKDGDLIEVNADKGIVRIL